MFAIVINDIIKVVPSPVLYSLYEDDFTLYRLGGSLQDVQRHSDCNKSGCTMGSIPWAKIVSKEDHGYAFPQKRKVPSLPQFRSKPIAFCPRGEVLGFKPSTFMGDNS